MNNTIINENCTKSKPGLNDANYSTYLCDKVTKNLQLSKNLEKIDNENILIPNFNESIFLYRYNYNLLQLKTIAKSYKLKISGNKQQLIIRIYSS